MLTRGALVKCNEHEAVVLKQVSEDAVQVCYLCDPAHNYTFEVPQQLKSHYGENEPIRRWMDKHYAGQKVQLVEGKTSQIYNVAALNYVELALCLQSENGECFPDWVPVETVYTIQMNGNDIRYGPFKKGDRVQIQVGVDTYLEGVFTRYHEEDSNMVWTKVDGYPDPYMELGWHINRVSLAEQEVSPEEAVRRGYERLKLDDPIDNPAHFIEGTDVRVVGHSARPHEVLAYDSLNDEYRVRRDGGEPFWISADLVAAWENDTINHPAHYTTGKIEVIDFIEDKGLGFHLGNVVKYVVRAEHKGKALEDLKKARWYLNREIERRENETS